MSAVDSAVSVTHRLRAEFETGCPQPVGDRDPALSTALNVSYMAEQLALFSLVVGIALLLAGVGFIVLAYAALRPPPGAATSPVTA